VQVIVAVQRPTTITARRQTYAEAIAIIEERPAVGLSLDTLAAELHTSRRHLQRIFRDVGDTTFRDELMRARMARAHELVTSTGQPVERVALAVGYRQPGEFAKAFRRWHGASPSALRARGA
jgi:AraC-like DNA-binding protein